MWDSAKKPIKVRSVLQRNGMRHFIVDQESDEIYLDSLQPLRRNSKSAVRPHAADGKDNLRQDQQHKLPERYKSSNGDDVPPDKNTNATLVRAREGSDSFPLLRSLTLNDSSEERRQLESDGDLFVIAGSKICNSKKHKRQHNNTRYFHQLPNSLKENSLLQLQKNMEMYKCQRSKTTDLLDLVPVKSPIIKNMINGRATSTSGGHGDLQQLSKTRNDPKDGVPSTTLCSRIMTWIDLEVKRNGGKGKSFSTVSFTSADLSIVNGLSLPCDLNPSHHEHNTSPTLSSSESSGSSGESNLSSSISSSSGSSSSSGCSSSALSFPKLVPCWRKEVVVDGGGSKAKKSVRISDDLPRWGKMKRRLRRRDRSLSLNQLYDDELTPSFMSDHYNVGESSKNLNKRNSQTSTSEKKFSTNNAAFKKEEEEEDEKETDSFVVCDQRLLASGRVQVHIFLPQTDSTKETKGDVSARSEDSTS